MAPRGIFMYMLKAVLMSEVMVCMFCRYKLDKRLASKLEPWLKSSLNEFTSLSMSAWKALVSVADSAVDCRLLVNFCAAFLRLLP
jgi:hypothetical protein